MPEVLFQRSDTGIKDGSMFHKINPQAKAILQRIANLTTEEAYYLLTYWEEERLFANLRWQNLYRKARGHPKLGESSIRMEVISAVRAGGIKDLTGLNFTAVEEICEAVVFSAQLGNSLTEEERNELTKPWQEAICFYDSSKQAHYEPSER